MSGAENLGVSWCIVRLVLSRVAACAPRVGCGPSCCSGLAWFQVTQPFGAHLEEASTIQHGWWGRLVHRACGGLVPVVDCGGVGMESECVQCGDVMCNDCWVGVVQEGREGRAAGL